MVQSLAVPVRAPISPWTQVKSRLLNETLALALQNHLHKNNEWGSVKQCQVDGAPVGIQTILKAGHCWSFSDVWRQSIPRSGRTNSNSRLPPGKVKMWLTDLEVVPSEVTSSWRFKTLLRRQVQVTVEQLVHRDESSMEKVSLHRGQFEFVEAFGVR